ncbi:LPD7 domain-containing protein [Candidatus Enterovibrio escicola]|uniref:LPD7 domain-containing protein n=1 Tax=Candidatus Enterovibrio escicola TaxID=1927127 RepID=UPI001237F5CE|nr:LPD7 domain-containing protein [Candidatus Enterovibrio escacola]
MLIRVSGGKAGIKEYLEEGVKNGRGYSRDELDERVVLDGDLELIDIIIQNMETEGEKYMHITLSFKEDHVDEDTLKAITKEFKDFAMMAYLDEELSFYAEAHLPKIKTYIDKSTGETVERKPHIHVIIPEKNLASGKRLEPFGLVRKNEHFIDAFQEIINEKYQLASPKHHVRTAFTTTISSHRIDIFSAQNRATKNQALDVLLEGNIISRHEFAQKLEAKGFEVTVRNEGKDYEYLNIRSPEQKRGVNLKDNVFQPQFVTLPKAAKLKLLDNQYNLYRENDESQFKASPRHHKDLEHWNNTRAYELRYVNRRNRQSYKNLTPELKQQFLAEKRIEHEQQRQPDLPRASFNDISDTLRVATKHLFNAQRNREHIKSGVRNLHHRRAIRAALANIKRHSGDQSPTHVKRASSDRLSQVQYDITNRLLPDVRHIKNNIDGLTLLHQLSKTHGVPLDKYPITKSNDGDDSILCGKRHLNVSDFLTKEMHFSWKECKQYLEDQYKEDRNVALSIAQMNQVIHALQFKRESRKAREQLINHAQVSKAEVTQMREEIGIVEDLEHVLQENNRKQGNKSKLSQEVQKFQSSKPKGEEGEKELTQFYDKNLEASRLLIQYPKLKELGISAKSITKTDKGDNIQYVDKQLTVTQLIKETHNLKTKEIIKELKPVYDIQEKDRQRVIKSKDNYTNNDRKSLFELEKKGSQDKSLPYVEHTLSPSHNLERERKVLIPNEPNRFGKHITYETNKQGHVTYFDAKGRLITDRGNNVLIEQQTDKAVEIGLRLAIEKYGNHLDITGTKEYQQKLIDISVTNKLNISFKDKKLNEQFIATRTKFEKGENIILKAEHIYKSQSRQTEQHQTQPQQQKSEKGWER